MGFQKTKNRFIGVVATSLLCSSLSTFGQGDLVSNNVQLVVKDSSFIVVNGDVKTQPGATLDNNGTISLKEDWINNSVSPALAIDSYGWVILNGGQQHFTGNSVTLFHNVRLEGANTQKRALIDVDIRNHLDLTNSALETDHFLVHLQNPSTNSLEWTSGFISGEFLDGYFLRSVNSTNPYIWPVGGYGLSFSHRAIELVPQNSDSTVFGIRLGELSASSETGISAANSIAPFNLASKESSLGLLNSTYFHTIYRFSGSAEALSNFYFFSSDANSTSSGNNGLFTAVGLWNSVDNEWKKGDFLISPILPNTRPDIGNPDRVATSTTILTYSDDPYVLSEVDLLFPTGFSPNDDGYNDYFVIENLEQYPDNKVEIYNRWGELVYQAAPYLNDWNGTNTSSGVKLQGDQVGEDTYFYILTLDENTPPIKNYLELIID